MGLQAIRLPEIAALVCLVGSFIKRHSLGQERSGFDGCACNRRSDENEGADFLGMGEGEVDGNAPSL